MCSKTALFALLLGSCYSSLTVRVEVYDQRLEAAASAASLVVASIERLPASLESAIPAYAEAWRVALSGAGDVFGGTPEQFADSYASVLRNEIASTDRQAQLLAANARDILNLARKDPLSPQDVDRVSAGASSLRQSFVLLVEELDRRVAKTALANSQALTEAAKKNNITLPDLTPLLAVASRAFAVQGITPIRNAAKRVVEITTVGMDDPDLPRIVGADRDHWRGIFNQVTASTSFGNAEIAIRMKALGVFTLKGVLFDPSQVTKATLDGIAAAVEVAAGAAGVPQVSAGSGSSATPAPSSAQPSDIAATAQAKNLESRNLAARSRLAWQLIGLGEGIDPLAVIPDANRDRVAAAVRAGADAIKQLNEQAGQ